MLIKTRTVTLTRADFHCRVISGWERTSCLERLANRGCLLIDGGSMAGVTRGTLGLTLKAARGARLGLVGLWWRIYGYFGVLCRAF